MAPMAGVTPVARILPNESNLRFTPGMVLAGRYRIIGLLGRGGMGEVYRADDIKLGTPVALKFLPWSVADDPVRRERFFAEVRNARQVARPNVGRVFDIVEAGTDGGRVFLAMEYVDGEDLGSLLLRIGRLPPDKALDTDVCAAVATERAVHPPARACRSARGRRGLLRLGPVHLLSGNRQSAGLVRGSRRDGAAGPRGAHAVRVHDRACRTP